MDNLLEELRALSDKADRKTIFNYFEVKIKQNGVRYQYEKINNVISRILLFFNGTNEPKNEFARECNGVVVDTINWVKLNNPLPFSSRNPNMEAVKKMTYDVYPIFDGTMVCLYNWNNPARGNEWCISTSHAYDITTNKWTGDRTYGEVVFETLNALAEFTSQTGMKLEGGRLTFDSLDKTQSYTFGFYHPCFHIYQKVSGAWQYMLNENQPKLPVVPTISKLDLTLDQILENCKKSDGTCYGYMLKSATESVIFTSKLMDLLKQVIYERVPLEYEEVVNNTNRVKFLKWRAYLSEDKYEIAETFGWETDFAEIDKKINELDSDKNVEAFLNL